MLWSDDKAVRQPSSSTKAPTATYSMSAHCPRIRAVWVCAILLGMLHWGAVAGWGDGDVAAVPLAGSEGALPADGLTMAEIMDVLRNTQDSAAGQAQAQATATPGQDMHKLEQLRLAYAPLVAKYGLWNATEERAVHSLAKSIRSRTPRKRQPTKDLPTAQSSPLDDDLVAVLTGKKSSEEVMGCSASDTPCLAAASQRMMAAHATNMTSPINQGRRLKDIACRSRPQMRGTKSTHWLLGGYVEVQPSWNGDIPGEVLEGWMNGNVKALLTMLGGQLLQTGFLTLKLPVIGIPFLVGGVGTLGGTFIGNAICGSQRVYHSEHDIRWNMVQQMWSHCGQWGCGGVVVMPPTRGLCNFCRGTIVAITGRYNGWEERNYMINWLTATPERWQQIATVESCWNQKWLQLDQQTTVRMVRNGQQWWQGSHITLTKSIYFC